MNKKSFFATDWLIGKHQNKDEPFAQDSLKSSLAFNSSKHLSSLLPPFKTIKKNTNPTSSNQELFNPSEFLIPGWAGDSLTSIDVKKFNELINHIYLNVKSQFNSDRNFPSKIKNSIYEEFLHYAECKAQNFFSIDNIPLFWEQLFDKDSEFRDSIDEFINIYCFKIAVLYFYKIRFIGIITSQLEHEFDINSLINPNSYLNKVFKKGSSHEIKAQSLQTNLYSWYRPSPQLGDSIKELLVVSNKIGITEIVKSFAISLEKLSKSESLYSHAFSHKNYGLFLNSLLINFPIWQNTNQKTSANPYRIPGNGLEVISCKYAGDYLESLTQSHWLAQDNNRYLKWDQILCPEFNGIEFETGQFMKLCHEMQFLTFLAMISIEQNFEPVSYVSAISQGHLNNRMNFGHSQRSFALGTQNDTHSTYDRIILNICNTPKNNSYHYLFNKIQSEYENLKDEGYLFLLSSKKLFIDSQKSKINNLLKKFNLEAIIDFKQLSGKGEIPTYLYIFCKNKISDQSSNTNNGKNLLNFRFSGELKSFQYFSNITDHLQSFFFANLGGIPPIYQNEDSDKFSIEFFNDAIVDGKLINSSLKDKQKITHPKFFKNLTKNCITLDQLFHLSNIDFDNALYARNPLVPQSLTQSDFVFIIDKRSKDETKIELIPASTLEAVAFEYGHTKCFYLGASPKWPWININCIRDFLNSHFGKQIVELTFISNDKKFKSTLNKLLIPRFLNESVELPNHLEHSLKTFNYTKEEILKIQPKKLFDDFSNYETFLDTLTTEFPGQVLSKISDFKGVIQQCRTQFDYNVEQDFSFSAPWFLSKLVEFKTNSIYPNNEDVYIEFNSKLDMNSIHLKLDKHTYSSNDKQHWVELYSENDLILKIYSSKYMTSFLSYILNSATNINISSILQALEIPTVADLEQVVSESKEFSNVYAQLESKLSKLFNSLISRSISL